MNTDKDTLEKHSAKLDMLEQDISSVRIKLIEHGVLLLNQGSHQMTCDDDRKKHEEMMVVMMKTQESMATTQEAMCDRQKASSEYDAKNAENLELISDLVHTAKTGKAALIWLAAVVGAMGTIAAGGAVVWLYMGNAALILSNL